MSISLFCLQILLNTLKVPPIIIILFVFNYAIEIIPLATVFYSSNIQLEICRKI